MITAKKDESSENSLYFLHNFFVLYIVSIENNQKIKENFVVILFFLLILLTL